MNLSYYSVQDLKKRSLTGPQIPGPLLLIDGFIIVPESGHCFVNKAQSGPRNQIQTRTLQVSGSYNC